MVVLLIVMGIGAVWMTAALPAWKQQSTREKEADLVFRGRQYVRALALYERKNGPGSRPPSIDILVDGKFIRRKYKDPITNDDFVPLFASATPTVGGAGQPGRTGGAPTVPTSPQAGGQGQAQGGLVIGVVSKSTAASIMVFAGATHYNEWQFVYQGNQTQQGGQQGGRQGGGVGTGGAGTGRGGQGGTGGPGGVGGGGAGRGGPQGGSQGQGRGGTQPPVPAGAGRGRGGF